MIGEVRNPRLNLWWMLLALIVGLLCALFVGRLWSDGAAEIAGIMSGCMVLNMRVFWEYRVTTWFWPLVAIWTVVHLSVVVFLVMPMKVQESNGLIFLIFAEYLGFGGLGVVAERLWGGIPEDS